MQTVAVQIQDNYMQNFMSYVSNHNENISIIKDKNLELDPYFYERQKQLQQDISDIDSGKVKFLSQSEYDNEIDSFFEQLEIKYAN